LLTQSDALVLGPKHSFNLTREPAR